MNETCVIEVKVFPQSKKISVSWKSSVVLVRLTAPPVDGKANKQLVEILADFFSLQKRSVILVAGETSRHKKIRLEGIGFQEVQDRFTKQLELDSLSHA